MNQKEYELIAETLKQIEPSIINYDLAIELVADNLEGAYKSFDRAKFLKACGIEVEA